jgi:sarcosine oxidase subunit gamma
VAELDRTPALHAAPIAATGVTVAPVALAGQVILRGDGAALGPAVHILLGCALPLEPCAMAEAGDVVAWLAPDRWLAASRDRAGSDLARAFADRLAGSVADAHDVTDGLAVIDVSGPAAAALLAGACNLDLHPRAFPPLQAARTLVGGVDAVLYRHGDGFRLHAARPLAQHLWDWLAAAARDLDP